MSDFALEGDTVLLKGMVFYGHHGVTEEERRDAQKFLVDIAVACDLREAGATDKLAATVDYAGLFGVAKSVILGPSVNLLETLAENIAQKTLKHYQIVEKVRVRVRKARPPLKGDLMWAAVDITRGR